VRDCEVSARFYAEAFGLRETRRIESEGRTRAVWLVAGEVVLMLEFALRGEGPVEGSGHALIFSTPDLRAAEERFRSLGIAVTDRTPYTLYVGDPDGHRVGASTFRFDPTPA